MTGNMAKKKENSIQLKSGPAIRYTTASGERTLDPNVAKKMVIEIMKQTQALTKKDLGKWRTAWQMAINADIPIRRFLYDIYTDVDIDLHLSGCIGQRKGFVKRKAFRMVNLSDGKENPDITKIFEAKWFTDLMNYALDSRYWGHSLIELGQPENSNGTPIYSYARLVPRKHVIPERGVIICNETDLWDMGYDYRHSDMADWVIEVGNDFDLGLFNKCAQQAIPKKNMLSFWDQFGEIFGMPVRIAKTISTDSKTVGKIENMLNNMGAAAWGLFPEGTEITLLEGQKSDAFHIYDERIARANSEMSKGILMQTMTIDSGASLSQSQVHFKIFENLIEDDAKMIREMVNNQLIPRMITHGFPVAGYRFDWDNAVQYTPEQRVAIDNMVLTNYDVDPKYFIDNYNIPVIGKKAPGLQLAHPDEHPFA